MTLAVGVLASGRGSNLQAILAACARPGFPARVAIGRQRLGKPLEIATSLEPGSFGVDPVTLVV